MSIETFCFVLDSGQLVEADPALDLLKSEDGDFRNAVDSVFAPWANTCCRPKDIYWHTHKSLMMRNGRVVQLIDEDDWRGRADEVHQWRDDESAKEATYASVLKPNEYDSWLQKIILYAMRQTVKAMFQYTIEDEDTVGGLTFDEAEFMNTEQVIRWFYNDIPAEISRMYGGLVSDNFPEHESDRHHRKERTHRVLAYEAFKGAMLPPFTKERYHPEQYRCYDLRGDPLAEIDVQRLVFLFTDIHLPD